jgi:hypothetical protein
VAKTGRKEVKMKEIVYQRPNRRKCYWLLRDCLKGHNQCSTRCPDYISVARAERIRKEKLAHIIEKNIRREMSKWG